MAIQVPPLWLILGTVVGYLTFFGFYGAEVLGEETEVDAPSSTGATALISFWSTVWDFIKGAFTILTFGAFSDVVTLPAALSWTLFLVFTLPWMFYLVNAIVEGVKALGGLIPFT